MQMNRAPDASGLETLWDSVVSEGDVRFWLPGDDLGSVGEIPETWREAVRPDSDPRAFVRRLWQPVEQLLPRTLDLLARHTDGLLLMTTASRPCSLVYCFGTDRQLFAQRGFLPCSAEASSQLAARTLPFDVLPFYRVHDGFVDFFASDGGPLPLAQWREVADPDGVAPTLLEFYVDGSRSAGFELSAHPARAWLLDPDEDEVRAIEQLWPWLDEVLASSLEDL